MIKNSYIITEITYLSSVLLRLGNITITYWETFICSHDWCLSFGATCLFRCEKINRWVKDTKTGVCQGELWPIMFIADLLELITTDFNLRLFRCTGSAVSVFLNVWREEVFWELNRWNCWTIQRAGELQEKWMLNKVAVKHWDSIFKSATELELAFCFGRDLIYLTVGEHWQFYC